jgi:uncharacterized protein (TIGR02246 family)
MRRIASLLIWVGVFAAVLSAGAARAQGDDEAKIRAIVQSSADAWNRGDAEAFAAHYAEDGSFTNVIGQQLYGKKAFIGQHAMIFSTIYKGSHCALTVSKITFLRQDVALVEVDAALTGAVHLPPGMKAEDDGALHTKLLEVMTKEKGEWVIAAFHNVGVYPLPAGGPPK